MNRPYIICHMVMSIDGKVTGEFLGNPNCIPATDVYYEINRNIKSNGFICGRITMETSFTNYWYPNLNEYNSAEKQDYIPDDLSGVYAVAFDTHGKLGWRSGRIIDEDPGYDGAQIIEVLSQQVDERYLGYLQSLSIPYIFAGKDSIDVDLALFKLKELFGIERLLLEGGSIINGSFLTSDCIDELSLVVASITANQEDKPLFSNAVMSDFRLTKAEINNGVLVLNYDKKKH